MDTMRPTTKGTKSIASIVARKIFIGKYPLSKKQNSLETVEPGKKFSETIWYGKAENTTENNSEKGI